jgi:hypothetical protein
MTAERRERVELWQDARGRWWWKYVGPDVELQSTSPYTTKEEAEHAAREAYPGLTIGDLGRREEMTGMPSRRWGRMTE